MLKILITLVVLFAPVITSHAELCGVRFEKVSKGGNRAWNASETLGCFDRGTTCQRTDIYCDETKVVPSAGGGYTLSGRITGIKYVSVGQSPTQQVTTDGSNVSFMVAEYQIRISGCTEYPFLNGVTVMADGVSTTESGRFTVFIPVFQ